MQTKADLTPFRSDGCSLWPDLNYRGCCVEHDRSYHRGGTAEDRFFADLALWSCVRGVGRPFIALLMFIGVRIFGGPWMPPFGPAKRFRWGYGRKCWTWYDPR